MANPDKEKQTRLGFLTVIEVADRGYLGGLLITTISGRPLEFQCTTPIMPNRTQQILYGPTLSPYVKGELIGKTLLERVQLKPMLLMTDQFDVLGVRQHTDTPVILLRTEETSMPRSLDGFIKRQHHKSELYTQLDHEADLALAAEFLKPVPAEADLAEPLLRTSDALRETLRSGAVA